MSKTSLIFSSALACFWLFSCDNQPTTVDACGDGFLDPGEECDGAEMPAQTCTELGYHQQNGALTCTAECTVDRSVCALQCGDGVISLDYEKCEGTNLGGESCAGLGLGSGTLACNDQCKFDTTGCENHAQCGDHVISAPFEQCEGTDLAGQTCQNLGYYGGALLCDPDCQFDLTPCEGFGRCGDNSIQSAYGEQCEGVNLGDTTCEDLNYYGGGLLCGDACRFDESPCVAVGRCGDGILQPEFGEVCDGDNLDGVTCRTLGLGAGTVTCNPDCVGTTVTCEFITLINVPAGTFARTYTTGDTSTVSAFRISETEVTRAQWTDVMGTDPSSTTYSSGAPGDPVQRVNWYHAIAFCNKLSIREGRTPVYAVGTIDFATLTFADIPTSNTPAWNSPSVNWTANGYRLPTEMEWMWAAMGAIDHFDRPFSGSDGVNAIGDYVVFGWDSGEPGATLTQRSDPVAGKLPNELGIYDLSGNVSEWVWDLYKVYPAGLLTDYHGPSSNTDDTRGRRGGSWTSSSGSVGLGDRTATGPHIRDYYIGFRVVRNP